MINLFGFSDKFMFNLVVVGIIVLCVFIIIMAIAINFVESGMRKKKSEKKSIVETGTMFLFFFFYYALIKFNIGYVNTGNSVLRIVLIIVGLILIILGTVVNVIGRFKLGKNWANQVVIYKDQTMVRDGVYGIVRHPLYASLIWMFFGGALVYSSYAAFLANLLVFIPFMYYRAKQEESFLLARFKEYKKYRQEVGMFFPRLK